MSFHGTGRRVVRRYDESWLHCDWCDKHIEEKNHHLPHIAVWDEMTVPAPGDGADTRDFCSMQCLAAWATEGKWRRTPSYAAAAERNMNAGQHP